jgi:hypothetical protein
MSLVECQQVVQRSSIGYDGRLGRLADSDVNSREMRFGQSALLAFSELHKPACAMAILRESILLSHFGNRVRSLLAKWGSRKLAGFE